MKGISTIIATILMLMITIALAGTAYLYISGAFTQQLQGIEVVDAFCTGSTVTISVRNLGTSSIGSFSCIQTAPSAEGAAGTPASNTCGSASATITMSLEPGTSSTFTDSCSGSGPRSCIYRLTPPSGKSKVVTATCT